MEPEDSLIMGDENLSTIPEKESDEVIKSGVEDLVLIPCEFEDTSDNDSECDLPFCDDSPPLDVLGGNFVTFSLFDSNDDFTSSDDESLSDEDVPEDNVKIYSNPLFKFDEEYIFSDVNPLFDDVIEDIECKASYDSNLDEPALLVTPFSAFNEDECFNPGGDVNEIELLFHRDPSTPKISVASILEGFTDEPPLEDNDDLFDLESKENEWKKILYDAPIDDLMIEDKVFNLGIHEKFFSPTYVSLPFEDRHYHSLTYVIRIFLPYLTYSMDSSLPLSSGSEDTIFDPDIFAFHFSSLEPVASHRSGTFMCFNVYLNILNESPIKICSSICFVPNITMPKCGGVLLSMVQRIENEAKTLALNKKNQHIFDVLKAKSVVIAFFKCVQLVVISTKSDLFQMFVIVSFDNRKLLNSNDSVSGVDIMSRFPVDCVSIELLTFSSPVRDVPE
ncbi:hypothetical protein Tco_1145382 [Tanacetum coccineum]